MAVNKSVAENWADDPRPRRRHRDRARSGRAGDGTRSRDEHGRPQDRVNRAYREQRLAKTARGERAQSYAAFVADYKLDPVRAAAVIAALTKKPARKKGKSAPAQ